MSEMLGYMAIMIGAVLILAGAAVGVGAIARHWERQDRRDRDDK